jgi:prevent-host-death family protein
MSGHRNKVDENTALKSAPRDSWNVETAKARFREVLRRAQEIGPQRITSRGKLTAVIISADQYARTRSARSGAARWIDTYRARCSGEMPLERLDDRGRQSAT